MKPCCFNFFFLEGFFFFCSYFFNVVKPAAILHFYRWSEAMKNTGCQNMLIYFSPFAISAVVRFTSMIGSCLTAVGNDDNGKILQRENSRCGFIKTANVSRSGYYSRLNTRENLHELGTCHPATIRT